MIFILTELGLIHIFRTFNPFDNHIRRHLAIHFLFYGFQDHSSRDFNFLRSFKTIRQNDHATRFKLEFVYVDTCTHIKCIFGQNGYSWTLIKYN